MNVHGPKATATVFVVDDDDSVREALSSLIRSVGLNVETFASAQAFEERFRSPVAVPACLVLDVRMPTTGGLELQAAMSTWKRQLPIIFITGHADIRTTVRAVKAGAVEFLPKPFAESDLLEAIDQSLALDRQAMTQQDDLADLRARHDALTPREREVLDLLLQGLRNKQSADRLGISEVTVKVHRHNVMDKMGATSLPALVDMLRRLGIRPPV